MKLAFVTIGASDNPADWSGIPLFMSQALATGGFELHRIQKLNGPRSVQLKARSLFRAKVLRENYSTYRHPKVLQFYARQAQEQILAQKPDVIVSCSSLPLAYLETDKPIVLWTDATFHSLLNFYSAYVDMSSAALREGHEAERAALDRCALAIYSSEWAAQSAVKRYGADPEKVKVISFGANFSDGLTEDEAEAAIAKRPADECRLLFLGVDWKRKGGDTAVEVAERLNLRGVRTKLVLAGVNLPGKKTFPEYVERVGFVNKHTPEGAEKLRRLLIESHFLTLPSVADCTPIVFSEANSFAVPCISTKVGGIPSVIKDGVNGCLVGLADAAKEATEAIAKTFSDRESYRRLALSSYREYRERLNWETSAQAVGQLIHQL
jgi:glycosyltransferase involved in cell wall biosynthesis